MTELFTVRTPPDAWHLFGEHFRPVVKTERILTENALDRVLAEQLISRQDLPNFRRSTVDGYAVNAGDTYGATPGLPAFLTIAGEVPMGQASDVKLGVGDAALVHTGGMIPSDANAVVMIENTQLVDATSIEVMTAASQGENVIQIGEDIRNGDPVLNPGRQIRPQDIGGLLALGITEIEVASRRASPSSPPATKSSSRISRSNPARYATSTPIRWPRWLYEQAAIPSASASCPITVRRWRPQPDRHSRRPTSSCFLPAVRSATAT